MTNFSMLLRPDRGEDATTVQVVDAKSFPSWLSGQPERVRSLLAAQQFVGKADQIAILPDAQESRFTVTAGVANVEQLGPWCLASAADRLPGGTYRLAGIDCGEAALGWLLSQYRFDTYKPSNTATAPTGPRTLLTTNPACIEETVRIATSTALVRDMVNTPAADMGPEAIGAIVRELAQSSGSQLNVTRGDDLALGYPMIHAVGRAADRSHAPRLLEMFWGDPSHPKIAIIGKGVTFDSGGLDIKPSSGMRLMKKDMGGAAHAIALARLVIAAHLPVRLHMLIPLAENAISGNAFRPGDILKSRKGLSVEIGNTDAEGRLLLGDALARACEESPEFIVDFATLTGAARVALGPDLPATFGNRAEPLATLINRGIAIGDPLWALPLWHPYADMLKSDVADISNSGEGGFAGSITAALFLERFVNSDVEWVHIDTFAWRAASKPGRPKGGDALGLRAVYADLLTRFGRKPGA